VARAMDNNGRTEASEMFAGNVLVSCKWNLFYFCSIVSFLFLFLLFVFILTSIPKTRSKEYK
jgi:uncharacterized integral membrane protein